MSMMMTKRGNAVGFTRLGETVCGMRCNKSVWRVFVAGPLGPRLTDDRTQTFVRLADASAYAASLIDTDATARLAWWSV